MKMKEKESVTSTKPRVRTRAVKAGGVGLVIFLMIFCIWALYGPFGISVVGHENATVFLGSSDTYWHARWDIYQALWSYDSYQTVDLYNVPESKVINYFTTKVFTENSSLHADPSRETGSLQLLYQMQWIQYNILVWSNDGADSPDGEFLIFNEIYDYKDYVETGYDQYKKYAVYHKNFTIGDADHPSHIKFEFETTTNPNNYFVTCSTPKNVTFAYVAIVNSTYYKHTDFQDYFSCTFAQSDHCTNITTPPLIQDENHLLLGYVRPQQEKDTSSTTHIIVVMYRLLPPPGSIAFMIIALVVAAVSTLTVCYVCS